MRGRSIARAARRSARALWRATISGRTHISHRCSLGARASQAARDQYEASQTMGTDVSLVMCAIGIEAEARYTKRSAVACGLSGGRGDIQNAYDLLKMRFPRPANREAASLRTERWARALVRSVPGWKAITAMAEALLERGILEWDEADALCAAAYGHQRPWLGDWMEQWPPSIRC